MTRWALVTGGAKGLGAELVKTLAGEGYSVLLHYRTSHREAEEMHSANPKAFPIWGDFSTSKGVAEFIRKVAHPISCLVHNVGPIELRSGVETTHTIWETLYQINFFSLLQLFDAFQKELEDIITIGVAGLNGSGADCKKTAYFATKLSVLQWTRSLGKELAPENVRCNMISPGELVGSLTLDRANLPMQRPAVFSEVSRVMLCLLRSPYITGQNIEVAGGYAI